MSVTYSKAFQGLSAFIAEKSIEAEGDEMPDHFFCGTPNENEVLWFICEDTMARVGDSSHAFAPPEFNECGLPCREVALGSWQAFVYSDVTDESESSEDDTDLISFADLTYTNRTLGSFICEDKMLWPDLRDKFVSYAEFELLDSGVLAFDVNVDHSSCGVTKYAARPNREQPIGFDFLLGDVVSQWGRDNDSVAVEDGFIYPETHSSFISGKLADEVPSPAGDSYVSLDEIVFEGEHAGDGTFYAFSSPTWGEWVPCPLGNLQAGVDGEYCPQIDYALYDDQCNSVDWGSWPEVEGMEIGGPLNYCWQALGGDQEVLKTFRDELLEAIDVDAGMRVICGNNKGAL